MRKEINYIKGDATAPVGENNKIIAHICNDIGRWGKGFVLALSERWAEPEQAYKNWYKKSDDFLPGAVQFVQVEPNLWVANIIGQHTIYNDKKGNPPIRYEWVRAGLAKVADFAVANNADVHMPRIGCGLAGGTWDKIEPLIDENLSDKGVEVTVYDF